MGVTFTPSFAQIRNRPTTVAGLGLSDFNNSAINAQAVANFGAVGTYAFLMQITAAGFLVEGSTYAGSTLMVSGADQNNSTRVLEGAAPSLGSTLSGTWRAMSRGGLGVGKPITLCLRIA